MARGIRLLLAFLLGACAQLPPELDPQEKFAALRDRLREAAPGEVVIVINNNAIGGTHAGMFAGNLLSDPSGSYVSHRSRDPRWPGPSVADYVAFQLEDGDNVRVYRFSLEAPEFAEIVARVRGAGPTPPLFCAVALQNQIAGVGPFSRIERIGWTSPSALAVRLDAAVTGNSVTAGACLRPSGAAC